jgi:hypothetical protein
MMQKKTVAEEDRATVNTPLSIFSDFSLKKTPQHEKIIAFRLDVTLFYYYRLPKQSPKQ